MNRRHFLLSSTFAAALPGGDIDSTRLAFLRSNSRHLRRPAPLGDALSYDQVREMVFRAIELAPPRAGSLEAKIQPGAWVVLKPNIVFLRPHPSYAPGDVTDFRVTRAVLEYVATRSRAGRITLAEGGTYRNPKDPAKDNVVLQDGQRVNAWNFDWGPNEFPGFHGSVGTLLQEFRERFPKTKFDYVDLSYDAVRDASGGFRRITVPLSANGVGAFGGRPDYFVTNTITGCDFLITIPVMKVHLQCGITACLKNYVGTAPRQAYAIPGVFHNYNLHEQHSLGGRIDPFIVDLAAFHPPDYCVVDGLRGLQSMEHSLGRKDQTVQSNMILAGEDPVAADATVARLLGFEPYDIEFLHMASKRGMGTMDSSRIQIRGDEPDRNTYRWEKPKNWYGRANRDWQLRTHEGPWKRHTARFDTLDLAQATGIAALPGTSYTASMTVHSDGHRRGFLWLGLRGRLSASLNQDLVARLESDTRFRVGQFQYPVELRPGANRIEFRIEPLGAQAQLSAQIVSPRNDGDTLEGIRYVL